MKTNLAKWFSIRKASKHGLGIKLKKQKANHDLSNAELLAINGRHWDTHNSIEHLRINETPSEWKVLMDFTEFKEFEL